MAQRPFPQRIGCHQTCVAPATLLSDERDEGESTSLRTDASRNGVCYLRVIRSFGDGTYQARVAARPELVRDGGYAIVLSEAELASVLPWDCRTPQRLFGYQLIWKWLYPEVAQTPQPRGALVQGQGTENRTAVLIPATCTA
jgi:hypothetical protein